MYPPFWVLSIPLGYVNVYWPRFYCAFLTQKAGVELDNANPRRQQEGGEVEANDFDGRIARSYSAHQNGWEAMSLWVAGALLASISGVKESTMSAVAAVWLVSRILYNMAYIVISDNRLSYIRSGIFAVSLTCSIILMIMAAEERS